MSTIINTESASAFIRDMDDPILKTLLDMAYAIIAKRYSNPITHQLAADLDLRFVTEVLVELFSERELLKKVLDGERPGAWDLDV